MGLIENEKGWHDKTTLENKLVKGRGMLSIDLFGVDEAPNLWLSLYRNVERDGVLTNTKVSCSVKVFDADDLSLMTPQGTYSASFRGQLDILLNNVEPCHKNSESFELVMEIKSSGENLMVPLGQVRLPHDPREQFEVLYYPVDDDICEGIRPI